MKNVDVRDGVAGGLDGGGRMVGAGFWTTVGYAVCEEVRAVGVVVVLYV